MLITGDEDGLYLTDFESLQIIKLESDFALTACGVAVNEPGTLVAAADFSGNVNIFTFNEESLESDLYLSSNIGVRPLVN